jgi:hypothetical protein
MNRYFPVLTAWTSGSALTTYFQVPFRCTLRNVAGALDDDPGDAETILFKDGANTVGTLTFDTDVSAGDKGVFTKDTTYGDTIFDEGDLITIVNSSADATAGCHVLIELDPYGLKA